MNNGEEEELNATNGRDGGLGCVLWVGGKEEIDLVDVDNGHHLVQMTKEGMDVKKMLEADRWDIIG